MPARSRGGNDQGKIGQHGQPGGELGHKVGRWAIVLLLMRLVNGHGIVIYVFDQWSMVMELIVEYCCSMHTHCPGK